MKRYIKSVFWLLSCAALLVACNDDNNANPVLRTPATFTMNTPANATELLDLSTATSIPVSWQYPALGFPMAVQYTLEVSATNQFTKAFNPSLGANEQTPDYAATDSVYSGLKGYVKGEELAKALQRVARYTKGAVPASQDTYLRMRAVIGPDTIYSNVITIKTIPYYVELNYTEFIYIPGGANTWTPEKAPALQSPTSDGVYTGFAYLNGGFKFTKERNWSGGEYNYTHFTTYPTGFTADGTNIAVATPGYYYLTADLVKKELKATAVTWSLIGDAVGGWSADVDMTYTKQGDVETWEVTTPMSAGAYKFRANHAWDINLGGTLTELALNGDNLNITEAGTYRITLYTSRNGTDTKLYAKAVKQ